MFHKKKTEKKDCLEKLLEDIKLIVKYARENSVALDTVEKTQQFLIKNRNKELDDKDIDLIISYYETLSRVLGKVTPKSLKATSDIDISYWRSISGRHLIKLWIFTAISTLYILVYNLINSKLFSLGLEASLNNIILQQVTEYLLPFTYGMLGACAYLLRVSAEKMRSREFNPDRIPEHWNRFVLGTLSGGVIALFIDENQLVPAGALGFLAGYSIDFLFETIDRLISAILPKSHTKNYSAIIQNRNLTSMISQYQNLHNKTQDAQQKEIISEVIDNLNSIKNDSKI